MNDAKKILLVDDDDDSRKLLIEMMTGIGLIVSNVNRATAALDLIECGYKPDAIIAKAKMTVLNGIGLARRLRENGSSIPVILITDDPSWEKDKIDAYAFGVILDGSLNASTIRQSLRSLVF